MAESKNTNAVVRENTHGKEVAQIVLNGYNIKAGGPLGKSGAMRSFKLTDGDLWSYWDIQSTFTVFAEDGQVAEARVAAMPVEYGALGFIEFL